MTIAMKRRAAALALFAAFVPAFGAPAPAAAPATSGYHLLKQVSMPKVTGWDYLSIEPAARLLFITDNSGALAFNIDTERLMGSVPNPPLARGIGFVHGVAFAPELSRGFVSLEMPPSVIAFDVASLKQSATIPVDPGPDAIVYDPFSKRVFSFNGKHTGVHDVSVIDAAATRPLERSSFPGFRRLPFRMAPGCYT